MGTILSSWCRRPACTCKAGLHTKMSQAARPGVEPGTPRSPRDMMSLSTSSCDSALALQQMDLMGVEPITPALQGAVATTGHAGPFSVAQEVRPGIEPGLRPYHGRVLPIHLQTVRVPCGSRTRLFGMEARRLCRSAKDTLLRIRRPRRVRMAGFEPALSCFRNTRVARLPHILILKTVQVAKAL